MRPRFEIKKIPLATTKISHSMQREKRGDTSPISLFLSRRRLSLGNTCGPTQTGQAEPTSTRRSHSAGRERREGCSGRPAVRVQAPGSFRALVPTSPPAESARRSPQRRTEEPVPATPPGASTPPARGLPAPGPH